MRHWFITGVSSGLGRALAETILARGEYVTGTVREAKAAASFEELAPGRARSTMLDVSDERSCRAAIAAAEPIDILVSNAGYSLEGMLEATPINDLRAQVDVHLIAPAVLIQAVLPAMRVRRSGHIIVIGSLAAHLRSGGTTAYAAVKAAVETLCVNLASEVSPFNIAVTAVSPGAFRTDLGKSRRSAASVIDDYAEADARRRAWFTEWSGTQRGNPAKAADAILALADMESPPSLFALGPDSIAGMRSHAADLLACAERSDTIGIATDF